MNYSAFYISIAGAAVSVPTLECPPYIMPYTAVFINPDRLLRKIPPMNVTLLDPLSPIILTYSGRYLLMSDQGFILSTHNSEEEAVAEWKIREASKTLNPPEKNPMLGMVL